MPTTSPTPIATSAHAIGVRDASLAAVPMALAVYTAVAVGLTWPLAGAITDHVLSNWEIQDILLVTWIQAWVLHAAWHEPLQVFAGNVLYPAGDAITRSELLVGNLPLFAPVYAASGNPVLALNVLVLASFALGGLFMHLLVRAWTGNSAAALVAGLAFAAAPWRLQYLHWPHLLSVQYLPLILLGLDRTLAAGRRGYGVLAGVAITLQILCSFYLGFMTLIVVAAYGVADVALAGVRRRGTVWRAAAPAVLIPMLVVLPLAVPYLRTARGLTGTDAFRASILTAMQGEGRDPTFIVLGFAGVGCVALAALLPAAVPFVAWRADRRMWIRIGALLLIALAAFGLSAGPAGMLNGRISPFAWLASLLPGFSLIRLPRRFGILVAFALSGLAGIGVASAVEVLRRHRFRALAAVLILMAVAAVTPTLRPAVHGATRLHPVPAGASIPAVYAWLARYGEHGPLLELPVGHHGLAMTRESTLAAARAMYFSIYHWLPILNGYTGYLPRSLHSLMPEADRLPDPAALQLLVDCTGLRWILVHDLTAAARRAWSEVDGVTLVRVFADSQGGTAALYAVQRPRGAPCRLDLRN